MALVWAIILTNPSGFRVTTQLVQKPQEAVAKIVHEFAVIIGLRG